MWLLSARSVIEGSFQSSLTEYLVETERPEYAILSHRWITGQEVSFRELRDAGHLKTAKSGWSKIQHTAQLALEHTPKLEWIWIDTCCINKEDPNEVSTAINSMYAWYRAAAVCFVYLQDVMPVPEALLTVIDETMDTRTDIEQHEKLVYNERMKIEIMESIQLHDGGWGHQTREDGSLTRTSWSIHPAVRPDLSETHEYQSGRRWVKPYNKLRKCDDVLSWCRDLSNSKWFTRGWTLQELIAPKECKFYTSEWTYIASRTRGSFARILGRITNIPAPLLKGHSQLENHSVAEKMSWAALRQTTRAEDIAYCLLGIFGVSMAPLYGEGQRTAFKRLQRKILKTGTHDNSMFLWTSARGIGGSYRDLFAEHPSEYEFSSLYTRYRFGSLKYQRDMDMTSLVGGIEFNASLVAPEQFDYLTFRSSLPTEADSALRWLHKTDDMYLLLLLHQEEEEHQLEAEDEQDSKTSREPDSVFIPAVILKRLTSGNSQFVRAFSAWTLHVALDQWIAKRGPYIIAKERIRVLHDASLLKLPAIEHNVQLAAVRFAKGILIPSRDGVNSTFDESPGIAVQCEQVSPSCSQIIIELDLRSIDVPRRNDCCKNVESPHRYVLSFIPASSDGKPFEIIERTLIKSSLATGAGAAEKHVVAYTECPDCHIYAESIDHGGPKLRLSFEDGLVIGSVANLVVSLRSESAQPAAVRNIPFRSIRNRGREPSSER